MEQTPPPARPPRASARPGPRPRAEYRWTNRKAYAFLEALAQHGKVAAAARAVGMTRQSAYKLRDRSPPLARDWALAQAHGRALRRGELAEPSPCAAQGDASGPQGDGSGAAR